MASLSSKTFTEMHEILSEVLSKKELNKFMKDVINMSLEDFNLHEWQKEKFEEMIAYNREKYAKEEGIKKDIEQNTIEMVKEMLKNDAEVEFISKVTKLSNEEIKKIEESMQD